ncbi:hypothetical protein [Pseudomonas fluorescens]|nr:hypothetical protein [Pseudomonas fluorescens]
MGYDITATATEQRHPQTGSVYEYSRLAGGRAAAGKVVGARGREPFGR